MKSLNQFLLIFSLVIISSIPISALNLYEVNQNLIASRKRELESVIRFARSQALVHVHNHEKGLLTREEAENRIVESLAAMNYGTRYVWVNDNNAIARVHIRPEISGKFQTSYIGQIHQLQNEDIIFFTRANVKPVEDKRVTKLNGVTKLPDWDWVIGYGAYMDDIENEFLDIAAKTIMLNVLIAMLISLTALCLFKFRPQAESS
ncbi:Cache type 2 domain protein [[Leptolyngbya] sp. PCC 7376]|uniref:cache domain-containing protein n=1 Tax=[Leptolyngbya] sp. PCC 7376 TaxID=111781 RepID=UPI00029F4A1A|nr:cache domain-containing protein [[Leptolyngbya] sp. PCC 7376]AFY36983.1 Cache type 2 domain protein [[Leptolyngbya] sp. PCC 7376]